MSSPTTVTAEISASGAITLPEDTPTITMSLQVGPMLIQFTTPHYLVARGSLPPTTDFHRKLLEGFALVAQLEAMKLQMQQQHSAGTAPEAMDGLITDAIAKETQFSTWLHELDAEAKRQMDAYTAAHSALPAAHPDYVAAKTAFEAGTGSEEAFRILQGPYLEHEGRILMEGQAWHAVRGAIIELGIASAQAALNAAGDGE